MHGTTKIEKVTIQRFKFKVENFKERTFKIKVLKNSPKIKYYENYFEDFNLDLVFFLSKEGYNKRWDFGQLFLFSLKNLELDKKNLQKFRDLLKTVTSWDLLEGKNESL